MIVHACMIELGQPEYWYPEKLKTVKIYVQLEACCLSVAAMKALRCSRDACTELQQFSN